MKIENTTKAVAGNPGAPSRTAGKSGENNAGAPAEGVAVQLSPLSARMQSIGSSLSGSDGVINAAQVAEIRQAIAEGRLAINPEAIADRLLDSVKELIRASRN